MATVSGPPLEGGPLAFRAPRLSSGRRRYSHWTPKQIADGWWNSPSHFGSLYGDPSANAVACGTYGAGRDGRGYQTVACITYRV